MIRYIDCHNHLAEVYTLDRPKAEKWIKDSTQKNISYYMQGGIGPENWDHQLNLKESFPAQVGLCFGLHPYWVSDNSEELCEIALDKLIKYLTKSTERMASVQAAPHTMPYLMALGEVGLDFRPHIAKNNEELQIRMMEQQIEISQWLNLPIVFHLVQAFPEAQKIIDLWGNKTIKGMIHSFNGPAEQAKYWLKKDLLLSIGGPVCHERNQKLKNSLLEIPLTHLIVETDSPDQPPPHYPRGENPPYSLWDVAKTIGKIRNLDAEEILDISNKNFQRVFGEIPNGNEPTNS